MIAVCQLNKKEDKIIFSEVLINPEIVEKSEKMFVQEEACLSLPGLE
jgi:peptide deformylase